MDLTSSGSLDHDLTLLKEIQLMAKEGMEASDVNLLEVRFTFNNQLSDKFNQLSLL